MGWRFHITSPNRPEPGTVIFEIKSGPYKPLPPEDIAPWAPAPSDLEGAAVFMKRMLEV